jgi:sterol desaturase/sphingolipid hydroxylase (fatty acid hydroxylase superfamily)
MRTRLPLPTLAEIAAQNAVYFLIEDYVVYWLHRWYHTEWAYKTFHHVHHEFTAPGGFAAIYAHPIEILLEFVPILVGIALVPPHVVTFWVWVAAMHLHAFEIHSG